jgi:hypothetical protein
MVHKLLHCDDIDVNVRNNNNESALLVAAKYGNADIVKALLQMPDINLYITFTGNNTISLTDNMLLKYAFGHEIKAMIAAKIHGVYHNYIEQNGYDVAADLMPSAPFADDENLVQPTAPMIVESINDYEESKELPSAISPISDEFYDQEDPVLYSDDEDPEPLYDL